MARLSIGGALSLAGRNRARKGFCLALVLAAAAPVSGATEPWPAEAYSEAVNLTAIDAGLNTVNWSGAFWNPETRTLWLACNSGYFWALVEDGGGSFRVATNAAGTQAKWSPGNDLESLCQADYGEPLVYLLDENGWIREYDVSQYGVVDENRRWMITNQCPEIGGLGPEGLAFVPDDWLLRQKFRHSNGNLYVSTNGMGGLMLVGHQNGGYLHVFDLNPTNSQFGYIGCYKTGQSETAGLEFDRSTGKLYIWHNCGGNSVEVTELNSYIDGAYRRLRPLVEYTAPYAGNLEGFALVPTPDSNNWCFIADDNNDNGKSVAWYRQFQPSEDLDGDSLPDGWELWNFGSVTQTVASADPDLDGENNGEEYMAGTDPVLATSVFALDGVLAGGDGLRLQWPGASNRVYEVEKTSDLANGFTQVVQSSLSSNGINLGFSGLESGAFYRVGVTLSE